MLPYLPRALSSKFWNDDCFASNGISILSHHMSHLKQSPSDNLVLDINELNHLDILLNETIIYCMSYIRGVSQWLQVISMDKIIPLLVITNLDYDRYPGIKSWYLAGYPTLFHRNILSLGGLLLSKETRQQALVFPIDIPSETAKRTS